jgi:hypothetical protein
MFFIALGCVFAAEYIYSLLKKNTARDAMIAAAIVFVLTEYKPPTHYWAVLLILLVHNYCLPITSWLARISRNPEKTALVIQKLTLLFLTLVSIKQLYVYPGSFKVIYFTIILILLLVAGNVHIPERLHRTAVLFIIVFALLPTAATIRLAINNPFELYPDYSKLEKEWKDVQLWAKNNTPLSSTFIVPVNMQGFRIYSQRPVFVEWTDGAAMHWQPGFESSWVKRLGELGYPKDEMLNNPGVFTGLARFGSIYENKRATGIYVQQSEPVFLRIKKEYGAGYVVEPQERTLNFPQVYENRAFRVYRIP